MIPVVFIADKSFIMPTAIAISSLVENKKPDTVYDIYIVAAECMEADFFKIKQIDLKECKVHTICVSLDKYKDIRQISHIPIACLLKFEICDYINNYDRLIYLDGDIYVRGDIAEIYEFDLDGAYIAGVPSHEMLYQNRKMINAGIMLFDAKRMRDEKMSQKLITERRKLGDRGSMDQQTFNLVMADRMAFLPNKYNFMPEAILGIERNLYPIDKLNSLFGTNYKCKKDMVNDALIIHYSSRAKPWNYSGIPCGKEWKMCYDRSVYSDEKLCTENMMVAHLKGVIRNLRLGGMKRLCKRAKYLISTWLGVADNNKMGWG